MRASSFFENVRIKIEDRTLIVTVNLPSTFSIDVHLIAGGEPLLHTFDFVADQCQVGEVKEHTFRFAAWYKLVVKNHEAKVICRMEIPVGVE